MRCSADIASTGRRYLELPDDRRAALHRLARERAGEEHRERRRVGTVGTDGEDSYGHEDVDSGFDGWVRQRVDHGPGYARAAYMATHGLMDAKRGQAEIDRYGDESDRLALAVQRWRLIEEIDAILEERGAPTPPEGQDDDDTTLRALGRQRRGYRARAMSAPETSHGFVTTRDVPRWAPDACQDADGRWRWHDASPSPRREAYERARLRDGDHAGPVGPCLKGLVTAKQQHDALWAAVRAVERAGTLTPLTDIVEKGRRRSVATLLSITKGIERHATSRGLRCYLVTLTCPGHMHRRYAEDGPRAGARVPHYDGTSPREAGHWLIRRHHDARQAARHVAPWYGLHVLEPHSDGTPHLHAAVWTTPAGMASYRRSMDRRGLRSHVDPAPAQRRSDPRPLVIKSWKKPTHHNKKRQAACAANYLYPYLLKQKSGDEYSIWRQGHGIRSFGFEGLRPGTLTDWQRAYDCAHDIQGAPDPLVRACLAQQSQDWQGALEAIGAFDRDRPCEHGPSRVLFPLYAHLRSSAGVRTQRLGSTWQGRWHVDPPRATARVVRVEKGGEGEGLRIFSIPQGEAASRPPPSSYVRASASGRPPGWWVCDPPESLRLPL